MNGVTFMPRLLSQELKHGPGGKTPKVIISGGVRLEVDANYKAQNPSSRSKKGSIHSQDQLSQRLNNYKLSVIEKREFQKKLKDDLEETMYSY